MRYRKKVQTSTNQQSKPTLTRTESNTDCVTPSSNMSQNALNQPFSFPDGGWVCSQCQNYNFSGRVKCNRCQKVKTK